MVVPTAHTETSMVIFLLRTPRGANNFVLDTDTVYYKRIWLKHDSVQSWVIISKEKQYQVAALRLRKGNELKPKGKTLTVCSINVTGSQRR